MHRKNRNEDFRDSARNVVYDSYRAVISHGGMINQLYRSFLRLPLTPGISFPTSDTGIHEWQVYRGERRVIRANSTVHLAMNPQ